MFINVIQKGRSLFQDFSQVSSPDAAKREALANPLFSWQATYVTYQRKKTVVLTHDESTLVVALVDINAKNRQTMETRFCDQLRLLYHDLGLSTADFQAYQRVSKLWQINQTVSRQQVGRLNLITPAVKAFLAERLMDDHKLSRKLSHIMRKTVTGDTVFWEDTPAMLATDQLVWHPAEIPALTDQSALQQTWVTLQKTAKVATAALESEDNRQFEKVAHQIQRVNRELIAAFIQFAQTKYAAKTVKSYQQALDFYLNEYLANRLVTVLDDDAAEVGDLYLHGGSLTECKRVQRTMKKFYQFLVQQQLMTKSAYQTIRSNLDESVELVLFELDEYDDFYD